MHRSTMMVQIEVRVNVSPTWLYSEVSMVGSSGCLALVVGREVLQQWSTFPAAVAVYYIHLDFGPELMSNARSLPVISISPTIDIKQQSAVHAWRTSYTNPLRTSFSPTDFILDRDAAHSDTFATCSQTTGSDTQHNTVLEPAIQCLFRLPVVTENGCGDVRPSISFEIGWVGVRRVGWI